LRFGDAVIGIGPEMEIAVEVIRKRLGENGVEVLYAETTMEAKKWVLWQEGTFFVKGSRFYALEQLFDEV
jgi:hypothetical protein